MSTCSSILAREIPWTKEPGGATIHGGHKESDITEQLKHATCFRPVKCLIAPHYSSIREGYCSDL